MLCALFLSFLNTAQATEIAVERAALGANDPAYNSIAVRLGLEAFNARAKGAGGRIGRALVLDGPPDAGAGEITDKGYIAQALARSRRAQTVAKLFADPPSSDVMVF